MNISLETNLADNNIAVCVKNKNKKIMFQNELCMDICGPRGSKICSIGCMKLYSDDNTQQWKENGSYVYKNTFVHNQYYDITVLAGDDTLITFLQPLQTNHQEALAFYQNKGLSDKEFEVITLVIQNHSNEEICENLRISKSTLKTHLNKIYRKVREQGQEPQFIPFKRR